MDRIMSIDLERHDLRKRLRGYDVRAVDTLLRGAARALHELSMENEALRERLAAQQDEIERARGQERAVTEILAQAQRAADETRAMAHKQADAILEDARLAGVQERLEGKRQVTELTSQLEQLRSERTRAERELRQLLERMMRDLDEVAPPTRAVIQLVEKEPSLQVVEGEADLAGV